MKVEITLQTDGGDVLSRVPLTDAQASSLLLTMIGVVPPIEVAEETSERPATRKKKAIEKPDKIDGDIEGFYKRKSQIPDDLKRTVEQMFVDGKSVPEVVEALGKRWAWSPASLYIIKSRLKSEGRL